MTSDEMKNRIWMSNLNWTKKINRLTIPGTHDSGSMFYILGHDYDRCQDKTYLEQLNSGIRFLDVRLRYLRSENGRLNFSVHHSSTFQQSYFDAESDYSNDPNTKNFVLQDCIAFLNANPSETIIMCIKQEYDKVDNMTFEEGLRMILQKDRREQMYFWVENWIPTLEEARGRIVLVNRLDDPETPENPSHPGYKPNYGILWPAWDKGIYQQSGIDVEDHYKDVTTNAKWGKVRDHLDKASGKAGSYGGDNDDYWYVTFVSCAPGNASPRDWANTMNPLLRDYLQDSANAPSANKRLGTILMDFPPQGVIDEITAYAKAAYPAPQSISQLNETGRGAISAIKPTRISVGTGGKPYVINDKQEVWHYDNFWTELPSQKATDIGVGPDGSVWVLGDTTTRNPGGYAIFKWNGSNWKRFPQGGGTRISVGPLGMLCVVNDEGEVWRYENNTWTQLGNPKAKDIGVSENGDIWIVGGEPSEKHSGNYRISRWDGSKWELLPQGAGTHITATNENLYITNHEQDVWRYDIKVQVWEKLDSPKAGDIGVDKYDRVWIINW